jgi:rubrerythrin
MQCGYFTTNPDPTSIGLARIKKFEMTNRYEDAANEYEKLGMQQKAEEARRKAKNAAVRQLDITELVEQLAQRGQTLTYFCCHCGAPLKIGAKHEILKTCPNCKYDLTVIDTAKLINLHL